MLVAQLKVLNGSTGPVNAHEDGRMQDGQETVDRDIVSSAFERRTAYACSSFRSGNHVEWDVAGQRAARCVTFSRGCSYVVSHRVISNTTPWLYVPPCSVTPYRFPKPSVIGPAAGPG